MSLNAESSDFLKRLKNRDPILLESIFSDCNPFLIKVLASNRIFNENAEDLIHQTWERFFTNLDKFEGRSTIRTFICGILINKIREHRRSIGRIVYEEDSETVINNSFAKEGWWNIAPKEPISMVYSSQLTVFIEDCMDGLTELQKSAFILKEVEQEESKNICNVLDVSISNLRVLIFRAKDKLRKCLETKLEVKSEVGK